MIPIAVELVAGVIAIVLVVVFLGNYAIVLNTLPLWIIIVGILALPLADFVQTLLKGGDEFESEQ
ncbi:MAG: hypothetical protein ACR2RL_06855 [Gammaproteobacteria bacterium]